MRGENTGPELEEGGGDAGITAGAACTGSISVMGGENKGKPLPKSGSGTAKAGTRPTMFALCLSPAKPALSLRNIFDFAFERLAVIASAA